MLIYLLLAACSVEEDSGNSLVTAWTLEDSPVVLTESLTVAPDEVLIIEPGVTVELGEDVNIIVQGELIARGTAEDLVTFTGSGDSWGSILFEDSSTDAVFQNVDDYESGSIIEYALIELGTRAIVLSSAAPYLHSIIFQDNYIPASVDTNGGAAIQLNYSSDARVRDCTFERNTAEIFAYGGAVSVYHSDPILQDNTFHENSAAYGGAIAAIMMASPIVGNTLTSNSTVSEGGAISLISSISAVLNNTISGNSALGDGGGLHVCTTCYPHAAPFVLDNTIINNTTSSSADEGAAGVGAAYLRQLKDNNIHDNLGADGASDFGWYHNLAEGYESSVSSPDITSNWWGTDNPELSIYDGNDNSDWRRVLESAP